MSAKNFYVVAVTNGSEYFAYVVGIPCHENLVDVVKYIGRQRDADNSNRVERVVSFTAFPTKRYALDTAKCWNEVWENEDKLWHDAHIYYRVVWA